MTDGTKKREELSTEKQALLALRRMRTKLEELEKTRTEPIAIVGLGCRFPGGASDSESFWRLLDGGVDAISRLPDGRWDRESFFDPDPEAPGKIVTPYGGFVSDIEKLDAAFFGISPREAAPLDPQQRLALEVSWEALENAGLAPDRLVGSETGVFFGVSTNDYAHLQIGNGDPTRIDAYFGTGVALASVAGRLSYLLGLSGPSLVVDTACSSSLVSVHLAASSLRARECDLALAGGVNVLLSPEVSVAFSRAQMMARDGRCKTFDAAADGYVRGEGCGVVVLERLGDALSAGHRVLALLRGSAVNQDGRSSGLTAPNELAQQAVIRRALASAGIDGKAVDYVEAHGTGTKLGDPIELQALAAALGEGREEAGPLVVGSVKTNLGHLEAAAGIAGLIKVVLSLQKGRIPPHLHFREPNPYVAWEEIPIAIPAEGRDWPRGERPRMAGVSSFGFTGTNAHVILEEAPASPGVETSPERDDALRVLLLSAKTETALETLAKRFEVHLRSSADAFADVCHTAQVGRARFPHRLAVVARTSAEAASKLEAFVSGEPRDGLLSHRVSSRSKIAFLFTGQGSQYEGMGRELFETEPVFREVLERCDLLLRKHLDRSLLSILYPERGGSEPSPLDETAYTQPALFALQAALTELWRSRGVEPAYVMGHSVGEYAAAWAAGVFDLERGLELVALRGALMQSLPPGGRMAAVFCDEKRVRAVLSSLANGQAAIELAAINSPNNVVLSGPGTDLARALEALKREGVKSRKLDVLRSFHSAAMDPILPAFEEEVARSPMSRPRLGLVSNRTGELAVEDLLAPTYWSAQLREPVRFQRGIETLVGKGCNVFVEIGPGTTLTAMGLECAPSGDALFVSSLRKNEKAASTVAESLAALAVHGVEIAGSRGRRVSLPTYPFERETYWFQTGPARKQASPGPSRSDWLYEVAWRELGTPGSPSRRFPEPSSVARGLEGVVSELARAHQVDTYERLLPAISALAADYVVAAMEELGFRPAPGERITAPASAETLGVVPRHARLWNRLLEILAEDGLLEREDSDSWLVRRWPEEVHLKERFDRLVRDLPAGRVELSLLESCGSRLASVLRGETNPLEILFPGGSVAGASRLYRETPAAKFVNGLVRETVARAITGMSPETPLRVIELGAGTGGTTAALLPLVSHARVEYCFTDVSPLFLSRAKAAFGDVPNLSFATLDLERDPAEQGFALGSFDIVVAANVLHATRDLRQALRHARSLLAPGGLLLLLEVVEKERFSDLTVGLTDGWWRFEDFHLRESYPLMGRSAWMSLLTEEGFSDPQALPDSTGPGAGAKQAVLLARRDDSSRERSILRRYRILVSPDEMAELAEALRRRFEERGADAKLIGPGANLEELAGLPPEAVDAVEPVEDDLTVVVFSDGSDLVSCCHRLAGVVRALASRNGDSAKLFVVTRGAQPVSSRVTEAGLASSPLWGMGRVVALEQPELWGGLIDLAPDAGPSEVDALADHIEDPRGEDQVALRGRRCFGARLERATARPESREWTPRPDGTYLVTGGLGFLGRRLCRWLASRGARSLVLTTRRELPLGELTEAGRVLSELRQRGVTVDVRRSDATNRKDLEALFRDLEAEGRFPVGIFHLAGAFPQARTVSELDESLLESTLRAKAEGAWHLHELTRWREMDCFVLFSSAAAIWGAKGMGAYAAANHYLDALAHHRASLGLPATSVDWARWGNTDEEHESYFEGVGLRVMAPDRAFDALGDLLSRDVVEQTVAAVDWDLFKSVYQAKGRRPFLERIEAPRSSKLEGVEGLEGAEAGRGESEPPAGALASRFQGAPEKRREAVTEYLRESLSEILGLGASARVPVEESLLSTGLDSLMAVRLKNRIASGLGVELPVAGLLDGTSVSDLVTRIEDRLEETPTETGSTSIPSTSRGEPLPLSFGQQRLWFLQQLDPESSLYNNVGIYRFVGDLDRKALHESLVRIVTRHEVLRTTYSVRDGVPVQKVHEVASAPPVGLPLVDLSPLDEPARKARLHRAIRLASTRPFDLAAGPVSRFVLLRLAPDAHVLLAVLHHVASDGWSFGLLIDEIVSHYREQTGDGAPLAELPIQYGDFASWERAEAARGAFAEKLDYWREELRGPLPGLQLPLDRERPPVPSFRGRTESVELSKRLRSDLAALGRRHEVTTFMTLLAGLAGLLGRMTGQTDLLIGSPTASRDNAQVKDLLGVFVNHLVLRIDVGSDPSFRELLSRVRRKALDGYRNQDLPFEMLLEELSPERDLSRTPLFQVYFNLLNLPEGRRALPGVDVEIQTPREAESKFDLTFYAVLRETTIEIAAVYNADLFERDTIAEMLRYYEALLEHGARDPDLPLSRIELVRSEPPRSDERVRARIGDARDAATTHGGESLVERFREQAKRNEKRIAVATPAHRWSYGELRARAHRVACCIQDRLHDRNQRVGLLLGHDAPMVAGVMGTLEAGMPYVPLDPGYPQDRLAAMLSDSDCGLVLTESRFEDLAAALAGPSVPVLAPDEPDEIDEIDAIDEIDPLDDRNEMASQVGPESLAYILYTSGSTGGPKGVMQSRGNLLQHATCYGESLRIGPSDRLSLLSSFSFDAAVMDIFGALLHGASLHPVDVRNDGLGSLARRLRDEEITILHSTPTLFRYFTNSLEPNEVLASVRAVILGGEEVRADDLDRFREHFPEGSVFVNGLGPTESTMSLQYFMDHETKLSRRRVPVGYPVRGTRMLLLDPEGRPNEIFGEIAIESEHVALGYWGKESLTRRAFSSAAEGARRVYRTGDMGRRLPDGAIEFLGRADGQVKIRGYRVEPREVEIVLEQHPDVREAVVVDQDNGRGERVLCAHVVLRPGVDFVNGANGELRRFLTERLPPYLVPSSIRPCDSIPLTPTGKIDRRGLAPVVDVRGGALSEHEQPRSEMEASLASLWREILAVERVARDESFFGLGGHSLLATQLASRVRKTLGVELPLRLVFEAPTLADMASRLEAELAEQRTERAPALVPLSRAAHRLSFDSPDRTRLAEALKNKR